MCTAKELTILNRLGMHLSTSGDHEGALMILGMALRLSISKRFRMLEAKIRNNMALVMLMANKQKLATRQFSKAMSLVAARVGTDNRFYRVLQSNQARALQQEINQMVLAA